MISGNTVENSSDVQVERGVTQGLVTIIWAGEMCDQEMSGVNGWIWL